MACGGCGKKRPGKITVNRKNVVSKSGVSSGRNAQPCPQCGSPMKYLHKLDRAENKITKVLYCIKPACRFQKPA